MVALAGQANILEAYRDDLSRRGGHPFGETDALWIEFGVLIAHVSVLSSDDRVRCLGAAAEAAHKLLDDETWKAGYRLDPSPPPDSETLEGRVRAMAEAVEDAGALATADAILCAFARAFPDASPLELGRIEAVRARLAWKTGDREMAEERYRRTADIGRLIDSDELHVRALIGRAVLARLVGNYPQSREAADKALELADRCGMNRLAATAHHMLLVADAVAGSFGTAIEHGWRAYALAIGDPVLEGEVLGNLGQLFLDLGHVSTASAAFRAVVDRRPPLRILLSALGGLALCSGYLQEFDTLATTECAILRYAKESRSTYEVANALLELATAARLAGRDTAEEYRARALAIASANGFHELVYRAEVSTPPPLPERHELTLPAMDVANAVRELVSV